MLILQTAPNAKDAFSRWPEAALACYIGAGLAQMAAVQATAWAQRYVCTPDELKQWYPGEFRKDQPSKWLRNLQYSHYRQAALWAGRARAAYHLGIVLLLFGILLACVPPGPVSASRGIVIVLAGTGFVGEIYWLARAEVLTPRLRGQMHAHLTAWLLAVGMQAFIVLRAVGASVVILSSTVAVCHLFWSWGAFHPHTWVGQLNARLSTPSRLSAAHVLVAAATAVVPLAFVVLPPLSSVTYRMALAAVCLPALLLSGGCCVWLCLQDRRRET
ncbi:hypothetical protein [Streptomyces sp. B21-083]|uniref:hypothetical protein n=1 Tax=Streptomyces sp. B21-083 TaxID=3039410 RepID=UPI002FF32841